MLRSGDHLPSTCLPARSPRTLRDVLDSKELDEERRWSILRQALAGLAQMHAQGIIHRDLKVWGVEPQQCLPLHIRCCCCTVAPASSCSSAEALAATFLPYCCLQPANTFLDSQGTVKLGDFGECVTQFEQLITCRNSAH